MPTPRQHTSKADRQKAYRERQAAARLAELSAKGLPRAAPISTMPSTARWKATQRLASELLQTTFDEMTDYQQERSEVWLESRQAEAFQETMDRLEEAIEALGNIPQTPKMHHS